MKCEFTVTHEIETVDEQGEPCTDWVDVDEVVVPVQVNGKVRARIVAHEAVEGSLLAETVKGGCTQIETSFDIESDADPALVAMVLRNAHNICIVGNTVRSGVEGAALNEVLAQTGKVLLLFSLLFSAGWLL